MKVETDHWLSVYNVCNTQNAIHNDENQYCHNFINPCGDVIVLNYVTVSSDVTVLNDGVIKLLFLLLYLPNGLGVCRL